tara:strand:+ start:3594 stop:5933 length:2340 start_codon:yes stop_codon:yes gene_type:complete
MGTYKELPRQKLPIKKKNKEWREDCVTSYISISNVGHTGGGTSNGRKSDLLRLYDFYNGEIMDKDYDYVLKPYGKTRSNFPSKMRNYPILKPIIDLLLGEKAKRPFNYTVSVTNADAVSQKEEKKQEMILESLRQRVINQLNEDGMQTGVPTEDVEMPEDIAKMFDRTYVDQRALIGQHSMNYILMEQEVKHKLQKAWFHFLVSGEAYTHRGVRNGEPFYDVINPIDVDYDLDPDLDYVEDGDWALVRKYVHASTVIDHYNDYLTPEDIDKLESPEQNILDSWLTSSTKTNPNNASRGNLLEVITVYWKSRKRIGFLTYMDPMTGSVEEMEVDDGFILPNEMKELGAQLEWLWVNEVWEGTRIDETILINIQPVSNQRGTMDNPSKCKLPINGLRYSDTNSDNISMISLGIPYQLNYNIYKYRLELAIARSKDIIAQFDINMIPKKWDMDKFMYFVEGTGIAWVDYNKEGIQLNPQHQSVMDMSIKTIEQYIVLLQSIMEEWEKLSGVNRQRQGQVGQYEGKASSQQSIVQSSHITEDIFRKFSRLEQKDMQALLDYSKEAWISGKKTMYAMPDGTSEFLSVDPLSHSESDYGIFMTDSGNEMEKLQKLEGLSQSMIQNGIPASTIAEMIDTQSFTQLKDKIRDAEESMQKLQQQQQQSQMQMEQDKLKTEQMKMENENVQNDKDRDNKLDIAELNNETALDIARMKSDTDSKQIDSSIETATMKDRTDKDKVRESRESTVSKERTDTMNMISEERKASADRESNEKIAKEKPTNTTEK